MIELVVKKGYTITVVSWENDADYYDKNSIIVDTLEEAESYFKLMGLCRSENNQPKGVIMLGNSNGFNENQTELIKEFMKEHSSIINPEYEFDDWDEWFYETTRPLLGSSENVTCRVMSSCVVTYSDVDVYSEIIFKQ